MKVEQQRESLFYSLSPSTRQGKGTGVKENDRADQSERVPHPVLLDSARNLVFHDPSPSFPGPSELDTLCSASHIRRHHSARRRLLIVDQLDLRDAAKKVGEERLVERAVEQVRPHPRRRVDDLEREGVDLRETGRSASALARGRGHTDEVLQRHLRGLVDRLEEGQDVVRVAVRDGDANVVVRVMLLPSLSLPPLEQMSAVSSRTEYEFSSFSLEPMARMLGE